MKNKRGFTLAEVLITIGILGVIAAVTLPALRANIDRNTWASGLQTNISLLNTAFNQMMAEEDVSDIRDTNLWTEYVKTNVTESNSNIKAEMDKYFRISKIDKNFPAKAYTLNNSTYTKDSARFYLGNSASLNILFKHNADFSPCSSTKTFCHPVAEIVLDVNGDKKPNVMGNDMFLLVLGENGIVYPVGGDDAYNYSSSLYPKWDSATGCQGKNPKDVNGNSCAGRVVDEGYKINYK